MLGSVSEAAECPGCHRTIEAIDTGEVEVETVAYYGPEPGANVPNCRELRLPCGRIALHHICTHPQLHDESDNPKLVWWACKEPQRKVDEQMRYELNCSICAERYLSERRN